MLEGAKLPAKPSASAWLFVLEAFSNGDSPFPGVGAAAPQRAKALLLPPALPSSTGICVLLLKFLKQTTRGLLLT